LRLPQTVVDVAAEKNSTLVMPFPVDLLRFFDRVTKSAPPDLPEAAEPDLPARAASVPVAAARHN
jgi:hypothetical protein